MATDVDLRRRQVEGYLSFGRIQREIEAAIAKLFAEEGLRRITPAQSAVLLALFQAREPLPARRIAEQLGLSEVTVGRFVHALTGARWIKRKVAPGDKRLYLLQPTRKAIDALPRFLRVVNTLMDGAFKGFDAAETERFIASFDKLAANLDEAWQTRRRYRRG